MITVKDGVDLSTLEPRMWHGARGAQKVYWERGHETLHITGGREGEHGYASWHYAAPYLRALDLDWPDASFEEDTDEARSKRLALRKAVLDEVGSRFESMAHLTHLHLELERG